ncbi:MAG TPA: SRPBCC domain-containing protein [Terriglobales bacterium]|nr:SRPBCC domain-containing protein [Terriglobales bacterium]
MAVEPEKQEIVITRIFDAPRELVWEAWTDPELFKRWWGPKDFTTPNSTIDLHEGGKYLYAMRDPEGKDYRGTGVYREIVKPERLVMTDNFADDQGNIVPASHYGMPGEWPDELLVTVTFEEAEDNKTKLTLRHVGIPMGEMSEQAKAGWNESFDKLAESLKGEAVISNTKFIHDPGKQELLITRTFDAPRERVFRALTDPDLIPQWWGPKRYSTAVDKMDLKPGGEWRFVQRDAEGNEFAFHGIYHEVEAPARLVYTSEFEGMPGHVSLETGMLEEQDGKTRFTGKSVYQAVEDRDGMLESGMEEGAAETWERLAELVSKL